MVTNSKATDKNDRLKKCVKEHITNSQVGFKPGPGHTDQIFAL